MRNRISRRVDVLESEGRSRQSEIQSSWATISFSCWKIAFAYYLGGLKSEDKDPGEAEARALNYQSREQYLEALLTGKNKDINNRFKTAARRLFAKWDVDFGRIPARSLPQTFIRMIDELPEQWRAWLDLNLRDEHRGASIGSEASTLLESFLCAANDQAFAPAEGQRPTFSRKSRVVTQIIPLRAQDVLRQECKASFWVFRRYMNPGMRLGWWQHEVADQLQGFYLSLVNGRRPKLVLTAPPQHGKSEQATDFTAWVAGKRPDLKTIRQL